MDHVHYEIHATRGDVYAMPGMIYTTLALSYRLYHEALHRQWCSAPGAVCSELSRSVWQSTLR